MNSRSDPFQRLTHALLAALGWYRKDRAGGVGMMGGLRMRRRNTLCQIVAGCLAFCLSHTVGFAQINHLDALREWLRNTEEAAQYVEKGDYIRAEQRLNLAIKEVRPYFPDTQRVMARSYCELARVLYHQKRYAEAEPLVQWSLTIREADKKASPGAVFQCVYTLGLIKSAQKKYGEAEQLFKRSLALQEKNLGNDHVNSAMIMNQLALVYIEQARLSEAEALYLKSIAIHERRAPNENLELADTAEQYAELLKRMKRPDDAQRWRARALAIRDNVATRAAKAQADRVEKEFRGFK
jgi:tetratricopeptide (TPR) repeat protein